MGIELQDMLNEVVITPYDAKITTRLSTICDKYAKEANTNTLDDHILSFVMNKPDMEFKKNIENIYKKQYPEEDPVVLPPLFTIVLSQYITIKAITENLRGKDQAIASLMLMNYMLYRKGTLVRLILPSYIHEMYYKMDQYINAQNLNIRYIDGNFKHIKGLLSDTNYLKTHFQETELTTEIRIMAKATCLYKQDKLIAKYMNEKNMQPYVKVYNFVSKLFEQADWLYMDNDVVKMLYVVIEEDVQKKFATIENIISELNQANVVVPNVTPVRSSLLLRYVVGIDKIPDEIKNKRLSVVEFGVYLYYEFFLERIIFDNHGNR